LEIEFQRTDAGDRDAVALAKAMTDEGHRVYADRGLIRAQDLDELLGPGDRMLIGRIDGRSVACGAVRAAEPGVGEIKRMYVVPELRGNGLGRAVLEALEAEAREMGFDRVRLDTGDRQTAIALYRSAGYRPIDAYNDSADLWFERDLADNVG
jgi:GNAT superfamily N-acetyltransferase